MEMQEIKPTENVSVSPPTAAPSASTSRPNRLFDRIVEHNLKYLRIVCKLGNLSFDVDVHNRRVSPTNSSIRWGWFYLICCACVLKTWYLAVTLLASLLNPEWLHILNFPFHLGFAICASTTLICLFLRPKVLCLSAVLLTEALARRDRVKSISSQQLILAAMPIGLTPLTLGTTIVFPLLTTIICQFGTLLLVVGIEWKMEATALYGFLRVVAYGLDAFPFLWLSIGAVFTMICHLVILEVLHSWCEDLQDNRLNLTECYGELVDIQIIIGFFNQIYADFVFMLKTFCFCVGIAAFVMVFWYGFDNFYMGAFNLYLGVICLIIYPLMYEKAALITGSMEMAKNSLLMATVGLQDERERNFWRRRIKSIRIVTILCGPRPVERESLPLFYEFFVSTFIDVLLTA